jgi:hypothetical protein
LDLAAKSESGDGTLATVFTEQTLVRSRSVVGRAVAGETFIVPADAKVGDMATIYTFNGTGSLIWELLETPRTVSEIAVAIAKQYNVDRERAERDVTDFISEMKAVGLVDVPALAAIAGD